MNNFFLQVIFSQSLNWVPFAVLVATILVVGYVFLYARISVERKQTLFIRLIYAIIGFRIGFAALKTGLQYYAWAHDPMGKLLLPPTQGITIFLRYVWTHFWINVLISIGVGLFVFVLLRVLQRRNERFFSTGEVALGTLLAIVVGWPHFVIFFPLVFVLVVLFSIVRSIFFKESFTTLGLPLIVAAMIALFIALPLLTVLHLEAWII